MSVLHNKFLRYTNRLLKNTRLHWPGDWRGKFKDSWFILHKLGIREAVLVAEMAMIWGHSDLSLAGDSAIVNTNTQQSISGERSGIGSAVGPDFDDG